jgi:Translocon-associated protein beta (TRAPB)
VAQVPPYQALKEAPKEIRQAATVALVCSAVSRALGILTSTIIIATLPTWFPGLLAHQPIPIALVIVTIGCAIVGAKGSRIRERVAARDFEKARSESLSTAILGFIIAGVIPGILYLFLYMRVGNVMVKRRPDDPKTVYLLPHPSEGLFLGRYIGWAAAYLLVLFVGYTQLPTGLRGISDWLSPVLGVHFNTLIVAVYLIFTNPLTYPPVLTLWITAGLLGGIIAGGKVGRGFMVGLAVFLSTLGAMGLAALSIFRGVTSGGFPNIPPPPPGFSLIAAATGPVATDLLPLFLQASSPTDPAFIQSVALTLARNAGLIFAIVTISGRAASLIWLGSIDLAKYVIVLIHGKPGLKESRNVVDRPVLKTAVILLMLLPIFAIPHFSTTSPPFQAAVPGPYEQRLDIALGMLGAPNMSLQLTNLDLSSKGLVQDNNYAGANVAAFIVNNNDSQALGNGQQSQMLQIISQPALVTFYSGDPKTTAAESAAVEAQFSQALGVPFTTIFSLPMGGSQTATIYAPNPELSNHDTLTKLVALLPGQSFSSLVNPANMQNVKYFAAIGIVPTTVNGVKITGFSFDMNVQFPRQYYKGGTHQLDLKTLLGFQGNIIGDPAANVSAITMSFQHGTILYSPLCCNPLYNNATSTYYLNVTSTSRPDFVANFNYPFAPDIVIQKTSSPDSGPVGTTHIVVVTIQNLDNVTVTGLNVSDTQTSSNYAQTLQISPSGAQALQAAILTPGNSLTLSYTVTTVSSGVYVLSPAIVNFLWTAPNNTKITYTIATDPTEITSLAGPITQFTRTFTDFQPYSYLLLIPLILTPVVETYRLVRRRAQRKKEKEMQSFYAAPSPPQQSIAKPPDPGNGSTSNNPSSS